METDQETAVVTEAIRAVLSETIQDAVLGRPDDILRLFVASAPQSDELEWLTVVSDILDGPNEGTVYDLDRQAIHMTSALEASTARIAATLAEADRSAGRPVVRNPVQMVAELADVAADTEILYHPDDWVWGPSGPPYQGGDEERNRDNGQHVHQVHAERYGVDLAGCYEMLDAWAAERAAPFLDAVEQQTGALTSTQQAVDSARAIYRDASTDAAAEQSALQAAHLLTEPGWGVVSALAGATSVRLEVARAALNARLLTEEGTHLELVGWGIIHGEARLRVLRDQWFEDAPSNRASSAKPFVEWFDTYSGGLPTYWLAVYMAAGMELARAIGGERGVVDGVLLGRQPMFL